MRKFRYKFSDLPDDYEFNKLPDFARFVKPDPNRYDYRQRKVRLWYAIFKPDLDAFWQFDIFIGKNVDAPNSLLVYRHDRPQFFDTAVKMAEAFIYNWYKRWYDNGESFGVGLDENELLDQEKTYVYALDTRRGMSG